MEVEVQDKAKVFRKAISGLLNTRYSNRPTIPNGYDYVEPTLAGCAHLVFEGHPNNKTGNIYLGPAKAAKSSAYQELINVNIGGIVNCSTNIPCYHNRSHNKSRIKYCCVVLHDEEAAEILTFL